MEDFVYMDYDYEDTGEVEYADYYEDDIYDMDALLDEEKEEQELVEPMTLQEIYNFCVVSTFNDSYRHLLGILTWSLLFLLSSRIIRLPSLVIHASSAAFGGALLWQIIEWRCNLVAGLFLITYLNLLSSHYVIKKWRGPSSFVIGVIYLIVCEVWLVSPVWWHAIRGIQMVLLMKVVSVGYDLDSAALKAAPNVLEMVGYALTPGTLIFGPWVPYSTYAGVLSPMKWSLKWCLKVGGKTALSLFFLIFSTCFVTWLIPDNSNRWLMAYRDALSFRSSHYFVSSLSEVSAALAGLEVPAVCDPLSVELPRSLVQAVVRWNTPMHRWLKLYVFKPSLASFSAFTALLFTYLVSALFHGLNFQLASVLLSLGFYTYTEHALRDKLASALGACVLARPCAPRCDHKLKGWSLVCVCVNSLFGALAVFHLAYLGTMFESGHGGAGAPERGYSMVHTLAKWSALSYASHWLALASYVLMSVL